MSDTRVSDTYRQVKEMAVGFELRPGDRINEVALSRDLGVSRTPLREALNRLVAENLVEFRPGEGFFCRALDPKAVFDLYEMRRILEASSVRLAAGRADDEALKTLRARHYDVRPDIARMTVAEAVTGDEAFHVDIAELSGNSELVRQLVAINERIRFVRWVDMAARVATTKGEHQAIVDALLVRDADRAEAVMREHIARRLDQITAVVREGISNIYVDGPGAVAGRVLEAG